MNSNFTNPFNLEGKKILITGASSGIGRASAILCARLGAIIVGVGRDEEKLESLIKEISEFNGILQVVKSDLTKSSEIDKLIEELNDLDGVVLCAGKGLTMPVQYCDRKKIDDIFDINLFSPIELTRILYKKKKLNKGASIVALSSMGGTLVFSGGNSIYGASKAALDSFMKFAAVEFAPRGIRVNTILPGMVDTPFIHRGAITEEQLMANAAKYPLKRYGKPEDIANSVVFLLSEASSWITGTSLFIDGGLSLI